MKLIQIAFKLNAIYSLYRCSIYIYTYIYIWCNICTYAYEILSCQNAVSRKLGNFSKLAISSAHLAIGLTGILSYEFVSVHTVPLWQEQIGYFSGQISFISLNLREVLAQESSARCFVLLALFGHCRRVPLLLLCWDFFFFLITSSEGLRKQFPVYSRTVMVCLQKKVLPGEGSSCLGGVFKVKTKWLVKRLELNSFNLG